MGPSVPNDAKFATKDRHLAVGRIEREAEIAETLGEHAELPLEVLASVTRVPPARRRVELLKDCRPRQTVKRRCQTPLDDRV
jgi:hypothetical protein